MKTRRTKFRSAPHALPPPPLLPDELIKEILSYLPVKSLVRFRCVSKSWKSLISDPQFVKLHLHRSATNADFTHRQLVYLRNSNDENHAISCSIRSLLDNPSPTIDKEHVYRLKGKGKRYRIFGSCNGLTCLVGYAFEECWVCLWNPATRLTSQKLPSFYVNLCSYLIGLTSFGIGYDHLSDTYKVVAIFYYRKEAFSLKTEVKVYSMGDNCWRNIQSFPAVPSLNQDGGVYLSGTINWLAVRNFGSGYKNSDTVINDRFVIVSLDLEKETCTQLSLPHIPDEVPCIEPTLWVLRDCLCVYFESKGTHFVVWQMKEFGVEKSWTQLVNLSYVYLGIRRLDFDDTLLPLCMSEDGDVMIVPKFTGSQAILYNWRDNRLEYCQIPDNVQWINTKLYVESLVSPISRVT